VFKIETGKLYTVVRSRWFLVFDERRSTIGIPEIAKDAVALALSKPHKRNVRTTRMERNGWKTRMEEQALWTCKFLIQGRVVELCFRNDETYESYIEKARKYLKVLGNCCLI